MTCRRYTFFFIALVLMMGCKSSSSKKISPVVQQEAPQKYIKLQDVQTPEVLEKLEPKKQEDTIRILYFNSFQASLLPVDQKEKKMGGLEYLHAMLQKQKNSKTLILTTGDFLPGDVQDKRPSIEALNLLGVHAATIGNLELNYESSFLQKKMS